MEIDEADAGRFSRFSLMIEIRGLKKKKKMLHEMDDTEKSTRACLFCNWMIQFRFHFDVQQLIKQRFTIRNSSCRGNRIVPFIKIIEQKYSIP